MRHRIPRSHIEPAKGSEKENIEYCSKEGDIVVVFHHNWIRTGLGLNNNNNWTLKRWEKLKRESLHKSTSTEQKHQNQNNRH